MRKKRSRLRWLGVLAGLNLLGLVIIYVAGHYVAERHAITTLIAYIPQPFYLIPTVFILGAMLVRRQGFRLLVLGVPTLLMAFLMLGMQPPTFGLGAPNLTVLTYNIHHAHGGWEEVRKVIEQADADIVCLQEADMVGRSKDAAFGTLEGYHHAFRESLAIFSRHPISNVQSIQLADTAVPALAVQTNGLQVVTVHLASFPDRARDVQKIRQWPRTFSKMASIHQKQVDRLTQFTRSVELPTLVCGDFNMPPRGQVYASVRKELQDSFDVAGTGAGFTFPSSFPVHRIDYVFTRDIEPVNVSVLPATVSDHRPVLAKLRR